MLRRIAILTTLTFLIYPQDLSFCLLTLIFQQYFACLPTSQRTPAFTLLPIPQQQTTVAQYSVNFEGKEASLFPCQTTVLGKFYAVGNGGGGGMSRHYWPSVHDDHCLFFLCSGFGRNKFPFSAHICNISLLYIGTRSQKQKIFFLLPQQTEDLCFYHSTRSIQVLPGFW